MQFYFCSNVNNWVVSNKNIRSLLIGIFLLVTFISHNAAQTPDNDLNWYLDTALSDEFNSDTINTAKWHILDCPSGDCCNWGGGNAFQKGNVNDSGGILRLRVDGPGHSPIPCNNRASYNSGGIESYSYNFSYGYLEIYAQLPGFYSNGQPCGLKFEPSFWMYYEKYDTSCLVIHNEIDPLIPDCVQYATANYDLCGWSYQNGNCGSYGVGSGVYLSPIPLFLSYHKYAVEWNTNMMLFYFDDIIFSENYNSPTFTMHPLKISINILLCDTAAQFCPNIIFPQYMSVDYFRYYKLNLDCGSNAVLLDSSDVANYAYSVKSSITFGDGSNSISLKSSDVKYFRAVDSITVYGTFTAPLGCEIGLIHTACN